MTSGTGGLPLVASRRLRGHGRRSCHRPGAEHAGCSHVPEDSNGSFADQLNDQVDDLSGVEPGASSWKSISCPLPAHRPWLP
ncbi:hypothetical protein QJS66_14920 [Kocuria rhizophila]|nr:hypothetical protein QJS66_14920 [Kocuria rhizophila]